MWEALYEKKFPFPQIVANATLKKKDKEMQKYPQMEPRSPCKGLASMTEKREICTVSKTL